MREGARYGAHKGYIAADEVRQGGRPGFWRCGCVNCILTCWRAPGWLPGTSDSQDTHWSHRRGRLKMGGGDARVALQDGGVGMSMCVADVVVGRTAVMVRDVKRRPLEAHADDWRPMHTTNPAPGHTSTTGERHRIAKTPSPCALFFWPGLESSSCEW
jgi:hypothetical protein